MKDLELAVLESRWWEKSNDSVRPLFDTLSTILCGNNSAYHYEMFASPESFREIIKRISDSDRARVLYIAAHGDEKNIYGPGDNKISFNIIKNCLATNRFNGVYFGSCEFMSRINAEKFFFDSDYVSPWWFSGFSSSVDWLQSSLFDIMFFDIYYKTLLKYKKNDEIYIIKKACELVRENFGPLCEQLEFDVFLMEKVRGPRGNNTMGRRVISALISDEEVRNYGPPVE